MDGRAFWANPNRPLPLLEAYKSWRDDRLAKIEEGVLQEADSKADFAEFLRGPIVRRMWGGYREVQGQYRRYAQVENMGDFRERRLFGINRLRGIGYVGDHGEYPGMRRTARPGAGLIIDTYGGVYAITRQAIRNDETGELLNRNPREMGRASARFVTEAMVALIEGNPTAPDGNPFYSVGRGNQVTTAPSEAAIAAMISYMEGQVDDDGEPIMVTPVTIATKTATNELIFRRILNSQLTGATANDTATTVFDKGTANPLAGIMPADAIIRDPYWNDPNDWYAFAAVDDVPAFAIGFLDGREEPFVGLKNPEVRNALGPGVDPYTFELDSVDFKVRLDFGVAAVDPRGAYRAIVP